MSVPPQMSDSSESFTDVHGTMVTDSPSPNTQHQQEPPTSEERLLLLWQQVTELTTLSHNLQSSLAEANQRVTYAKERAIRAEQQANLARDSANTRVAAPANKVKVRKPDDFDGSREKVDYFLRQLKGYLAQEPSLNAEAQLNIALGFCVGKIAGTWADMQANLIADHKDGRLEDLNGFEKRLRETFGDPEKGSTARHKLSLLKQQGTPIEQFIIKFEMLEADAGLDEVALTDIWKKALDKHIWDKCYEALEIPKTLKEWKERCLIYDRNFRRRDEESKLRTSYPTKKFIPYNNRYSNNHYNNNNRNYVGQPNTNPPANFNRPPAPATPSNPVQVPMDIDRARRPQGANIQCHTLICYKCGKPGHRRFECPENRIRVIEVAETEEKEEEKDFPEANEE